MSERQKKKLAQREANRLKRRMIEKVLSNSKTNNGAFNLNLLVDGWLELESDPGTFSLLIEDFGCYGAQVDEVYDLEQKFDGPVFGFIFLFKWLNNQQNDRSRLQKSTSNNTTNNNNNNNNSIDNDKEQSPDERPNQPGEWSYVKDEKIIGEMFFAKQTISNSCATHALISILLNCDYDELNLGPTLTRLKDHTKIMNPENKGYAIGNLPELAKAHNSHASYSSLYNRNKLSSHSAQGMSYMISGNQRTNLQQQNKHDAYHFVSYIPINNRLYELDGLKNYPIDHGPIGPKEDWTEKFRGVIKQRLFANNKTGDDSTVSNDIRYNLMAVVPDRRVCLRAQIKNLKQHQKMVQDSIKRLTKRVFTPMSIDTDIPNPPYSPLSNGTLTASESGSVCNSPTNLDQSHLSGDESKVDKYFFIKFDPKADETNTKEDNSVPAHKTHHTNGTAIEIEITQVNGFNEVREVKKSDDIDEENQAEQVVPVKETDEVEKVEEVPAHNNEKYNLSNEPPFDFNILDEMQHVHCVFTKSTLKDLMALSKRLDGELDKLESSLNEEIDKRRKYKVDNSRRTHNYEPFIMTFLSLLAKQGNLADLIEKDLGLIPEEPTAAPITSNSTITTTTTTNSSSSNNTNNNNPSKVVGEQPTLPRKPGRKPNLNKPNKPKYKYVSTGRPVGRPRKHPLVPPK